MLCEFCMQGVPAADVNAVTLVLVLDKISHLQLKHDADGDPSTDHRPMQLGAGLSRARRKDIGMKCKRLIDAGRLHFLTSTAFPSAESVLYVDESVTGENRLLLGTV